MALACLCLVTLATAACEFASPGRPSGMADRSRWGTSAVFTPAHATPGEASAAFFDRRPATVEQPFDFSHQIHLSKGAVCTDCHIGVEQGPRAGLPSVNTCMICHSQIATDRPLIQQLTRMQEQGLDLNWRRVYDYQPQAHVRFEHAPHIRAKVECSTCHGNQAEQTVARRAVNMTMSFCVNCHKEKQASNDCLTCHY
ncbi:MAG: cytochrome c3 family protein [Acidobacteriota bacterium]|nr:cytochrome c3 family protein [Acidobacteriota bacterium]